MPKGSQEEVMTPGQHQKSYLAGALDPTTGTLLHCLGARKTNALFRDLLDVLNARYPAERYTRLYVVVDNYKIHQANAVEDWLAAHPRVTLLWLPTYCPAPTRLSAPAAMCMTAAPAIISGIASPISSPMWKTICT
jgi:hypothetical protein